MTSFERWQRPMSISCGFAPVEVAARLEVGDDPLPRLVPVEPGVAVAGSLIVASSARIVIIGRSWRRPVA